MTARAELETKITGTDAAIRNLDGLAEAMKRTERQTQDTWKRLNSLRELWSSPAKADGGWSQGERVLMSIAKAGADIASRQIGDVASAVTGPAKTSYQGAIALANVYRDTTQRVAISTGQNYGEIAKQIMGASQRLGLLPQQVQDYAEGVQQVTGDWQGAMGGIDAYQRYALRTNRTLQEMIPLTASLTQAFRVKPGQETQSFLGSLVREADRAQVGVQVLERAVMGFQSTWTRLSSDRGPTALALAGDIMGGAPTAEIGESRLGAVGMLGTAHRRYLERRARSMGKLGKGQHLYDAEGRSSAEQMLTMLEVFQKDVQRHYGTTDVMELMGRSEESGFMQAQDIAGLMKLNIPGIRKRAAQATGKEGPDALQVWAQADAGKRRFAVAAKVAKDIGLGGGALLSAQDKAVSMGGGAAGVAIASAGQVFGQAANVFSQAVQIFAGKATTAAVTGGAVSAVTGAGAGAGVSAGTAALTGATALAAPAALGLGVVAVGAGTYYAAQENERKEQAKAAEREAAKQQGFASVGAYRRSASRVDADTSAPLPMMSGTNTQEVADAIAKAMAGQTLRVQNIQPATSPLGMSPQP